MSQQRLQHLNTIRSVVVKLGSQLLTDKTTARLDPAFMGRIAAQVVAMRDRGMDVTLVSSGAVAAGMAQLGLSRRPTDLAHLQAVAAVGQRRLMDVWADVFEPLKLPVAQLLLTREDIDDRTRFLNVRNTIHAAQEMGAVPIINENDTISTSEIVKITFGDNDILAAMVAAAMRANLLVLLTVVDGVLDESGSAVRLIESLDQAQSLVRIEKSAMGKGGMSSKLEAARMITDAGEVMIVADGREENVLLRALDGDEVGTMFAPSSRKRNGRGRWIGAARAAGSIIIDDGAVCALRDKNRSLLPAGILRVEGDFSPGDIVAIASSDGLAIARGLSNYSNRDIDRIRGKKTGEVRAMLGEAAYDEVVHRSNLILLPAGRKP